VFVQLPPPVHGVTSMNAAVVASRAINERAELRVLPLRFSSTLEELNRFSPRKLGVFVRTWCSLVWTLARFRPDVVYFTPVPRPPAFFRDLAFIAPMKIARVRLILHLHGMGIADASDSAFMRAVYRFAFGSALVVSLSRGVESAELGRLCLEPSRRAVVENGVAAVDVAAFRAACTRGTVPRILSLSNTSPSKGSRVLLKALEMLRARGVEFEAELVGESRAQWDAELRAAVKTAGLESHVSLPGALFGDDKALALARADVFVHPTLDDCFPLVLIEAMQFALPIVTTRVGAIPEMVVDGESGLLCDAGDATALAAHLESLLSQPALAQAMGERGRRRYVERYTLERFEARMLEVFERVSG
jgi:glycosyltransferase involved in cell wall biosynthesis